MMLLNAGDSLPLVTTVWPVSAVWKASELMQLTVAASTKEGNHGHQRCGKKNPFRRVLAKFVI